MIEQPTCPKTYQEFIEEHSFTDDNEYYTNGVMLMTVYRVMEMIERYFIPKSAARQFEEAVMPFKKTDEIEDLKERISSLERMAIKNLETENKDLKAKLETINNLSDLRTGKLDDIMKPGPRH